MSQASLSIYAYNKANLVQVGDIVAQGQTIAQVGSIKPDDSGVYFEIRENGKSVLPQNYYDAVATIQ